MTRALFGLLLTVLSLAFAYVTAEHRPVQPVTFTPHAWREPVGSARRARVTLDVGVGNVRVTPNASKGHAVQGTAKVRSDWRVERQVKREGSVLDVTYTQNETSTRFGMPVPWASRLRAEWQVRLSATLPLDLIVESGVGDTRIDLTGLTLRSLTLEKSVGDASITLPAAGGYVATVTAGVGRVTLRVPRGLGVRIHTEQGVGEIVAPRDYTQGGGVYTSPRFDTASERVSVTVHSGVGQIRLEEIP